MQTKFLFLEILILNMNSERFGYHGKVLWIDLSNEISL